MQFVQNHLQLIISLALIAILLLTIVLIFANGIFPCNVIQYTYEWLQGERKEIFAGAAP